jgi:hypothetical protein
VRHQAPGRSSVLVVVVDVVGVAGMLVTGTPRLRYLPEPGPAGPGVGGGCAPSAATVLLLWCCCCGAAAVVLLRVVSCRALYEVVEQSDKSLIRSLTTAA